MVRCLPIMNKSKEHLHVLIKAQFMYYRKTEYLFRACRIFLRPGLWEKKKKTMICAIVPGHRELKVQWTLNITMQCKTSRISKLLWETHSCQHWWRQKWHQADSSGRSLILAGTCSSIKSQQKRKKNANLPTFMSPGNASMEKRLNLKNINWAYTDS